MVEEKIKNFEELKNFKKALLSKKEPHTLLFVTADSLLSQKTIQVFAQVILCKELCGQCANCKKFLSNNHPDVSYFPTKNQLLVEDSNKISAESFVKPIFADKKIFVIYDIDKSTEEAQNKLLKIFEEPNENVFYLISTSNMEKVLPTIRSRCFKIYLGKTLQKDIEGEINQKCDKQLVLELGRGNLGKTVVLSNMKDLNEIFEIAVSVLRDMKASKQVVVYANKILSKKDSFDLFIEILSVLLEDILAKLCKKEDLMILKSKKDVLSQIASDYSVKSVCEIEKLLNKVVVERNFNVVLNTIVDNLLLGILEVKYLCK